MAQVGVALEHEAVHLPRLPLVPLGAVEDVVDGRHGRRLVVEVGLDGDADMAARRIEAGEHLEASLPAGHAGHPAAFGLTFCGFEGGDRARFTRLRLGLVFGLGLRRLLGVGRLVGVRFRFDGEGFGVLGVGRRRHPVEAGEEVEIDEPGALARFSGAAPLGGRNPDPEVAAGDVLADDGVAER